jgi:hypothetical protein
MIEDQERGIVYDPAEPRVHEYGTGTASEYATGAGKTQRQRARGESTVGLLSGLAHDVTTLVKQEAALVRAEVGEKVEQAKAGVAETATGALVAYSGFLFLLLAGVLALNEWIEQGWLAALIVGGVVLLVGLILLARGRSNLKTTNLVPERTKEQLEEDARMVRKELRPQPRPETRPGEPRDPRPVDPRGQPRPEAGGAL